MNELLNNIKNVVNILDVIDKIIEEQPNKLQKIDYELSDLYHLIENNDLDKESSYKIVKRIHDLRLIRRDLNNLYELEKVYTTHKSKLTGNETRQFLMTEINKSLKNLNCDYKNRVLVESDIDELFQKKKRGRPKKGE